MSQEAPTVEEQQAPAVDEQEDAPVEPAAAATPVDEQVTPGGVLTRRSASACDDTSIAQA